MFLGKLLRSAPLPLLCLVLMGCEPAARIRQYKVPKLAVSSSKSESAGPRTMLGAVVLAGPSAWFFKVTGEPDVVRGIRDEVQSFLRDVRFSPAGEKPVWTLPEGWKERPGDDIRLATIEIPTSGEPLELSVTGLPRGEDDAEYVLQNVNRWRGQVGLPPTTRESLEKEAEKFTIGEFPCTVVELTGGGSGGMSGPLGGGQLPRLPSAPSAAAERGDPKLSFDIPEGWQEQPLGPLRRGSFAVTEGGQKLDISVTDLTLGGGDVTANVNRWRQQVKLPEQSAAEVEQSLRTVTGNEMEWKVVELVGDEETILGAIGTTTSAAWFVKAKGDSALAAREKGRFEEFVKSLKIE